MRVGKPPSCRSARVGTRRGGRHLAPLSRPPWRVFFSPFIASFGPCLLGGRPGQPGAGRGRRYAGGKPPPSASDQPSASGLRGNCSIGATAILALYALCVAWQVLARPSQHAAAVKCHFGVLRRPSAMPVEHLPAEKGPVCAPYKEGGPKSRPTRSPRGSARKPTRQEVGAPPPADNPGASGSICSTTPIFNFRWGRFLWAGVVARTRGRARPNGKETACSVRLWKCTAASISSCDER